MDITPLSFTACIYRFEGPTLLALKDEWKIPEGKFLISAFPHSKVDPKGLFAFVCDGIETFTVHKERLAKVRTVSVSYERLSYMTAVDEVKAKIKAMNLYLLNLLPTLHAKSNAETV